MKVLKFGGSSVASAANIEKVVNIVLAQKETDKIAVVVSAMSGVTDSLLKMATLAASADETYKKIVEELEQKHLELVRALLPIQQQSATLSLVKQHLNELESICDGVYLLKELSLRTQDKIVGYGELLSSQIIAAKFQSLNEKQLWVDSRHLITTNSNYSNASVDFTITNERIFSWFKANDAKYYIIPGYIAANLAEHTTTLGRGGSDYTAAIYAAALDASVLEIWTDVSGMMTADPRLVSNAKPIERISYQEAMELSHFGAKIIYPPTIQPVMIKKIPVWIKIHLHHLIMEH